MEGQTDGAGDDAPDKKSGFTMPRL